MSSNLLKTLSFVTIIMGFFMALLDTTIVNIALPEMARYFGASQKDMSWVVNAYNLAFAVFIITASRIADQFGRKKIFLIGVSVFTMSSVMCGLSNSLNLLIFFRVVEGLAAAIIVPVTIPMVLELFGKEKMAAVMGAWAAIAGLAAASGPALGGIITDNLNWQWIFYVNLPFGIVTILLSLLLIKESYDPTAGKRIDFGGIASLSAAMFSLTFALIQANEYGWGSPVIIGLFAVSVTAFAGFFVIESKVGEPMLPLSLFRIGPFVGATMTLLFMGAGMMSAIFMTAFYLTSVMGLSVLQAGLTVSVMPLGSIATSAFAGPLSTRLGSRIFAVIGMALMALSVFLLGGLTADSSRVDVVWRLLINGAGMGMTIAPVMGSAVRVTPREKSGIVSGIINMSRALGTVVGVAVLVAILNSTMSTAFVETKYRIGKMVENDTVLDERVKTGISGSISGVKMSGTRDMPRVDVVLKRLVQEEEMILAQVPLERKETIKAFFIVQKEEVSRLWGMIWMEVRRGMASAFDRAYRYGSLILLIGILFAAFSDEKRARNGAEGEGRLAVAAKVLD